VLWSPRVRVTCETNVAVLAVSLREAILSSTVRVGGRSLERGPREDVGVMDSDPVV
jgi:hypothetical protein